MAADIEREVQILAGQPMLTGNLSVPPARPVSFSSRTAAEAAATAHATFFVARTLQRAGIGTLLFDLLTRAEEEVDIYTREHRFDIGLLAARLAYATQWIDGESGLRDARIGYFGASTGSAAALVAAAKLGDRVSAVVSRGGRPDLAGEALPQVTAPTLLIVGGADDVVIELNQRSSGASAFTAAIDHRSSSGDVSSFWWTMASPPAPPCAQRQLP